MTDIVKYEGDAQQLPATLDKAEQAIEIANNPAEINQVLAMMDAAVAFANRYYKGQRDLIQRAKGLQARAERKLGELLRAMPKATGIRMAGRDSVGGTVLVPPKNEPTLAEIGIDKKTSARAQKLADLPDDVFAAVEAGKVSVTKAVAPTKPKCAPLKPAKPSEAEKLKEEIATLKDQLEEVTDSAAVLAQEVEANTIEHGGNKDSEVKVLIERLRIAEGQRDQYMEKCNQLIRQNTSLQKVIAKLEGGRRAA